MKLLVVVLIGLLAGQVQGIEPWMYPVSDSSRDLRSKTVANSYVETEGFRSLEGSARVVDAKVASFSEIVKWYCDQCGETQLLKSLQRYEAGGSPGAGIGVFDSQSTALATHLIYRFTPNHKQVTIIHNDKSGDVIAISLLGLEDATSVHVVRQRKKNASPTLNLGQ